MAFPSYRRRHTATPSALARGVARRLLAEYTTYLAFGAFRTALPDSYLSCLLRPPQSQNTICLPRRRWRALVDVRRVA